MGGDPGEGDMGPAFHWRASRSVPAGLEMELNWAGAGAGHPQSITAGAQAAAAFIGREADGEGEGLISLIKCVGRGNRLHFPTHKTQLGHLGVQPPHDHPQA